MFTTFLYIALSLNGFGGSVPPSDTPQSVCDHPLAPVSAPSAMMVVTFVFPDGSVQTQLFDVYIDSESGYMNYAPANGNYGANPLWSNSPPQTPPQWTTEQLITFVALGLIALNGLRRRRTAEPRIAEH